MSEANETNGIRTIVAHVAAAYFENNHVGPSDIPTVIAQIATSLAGVGVPQPAADAPNEAAGPQLTKAQIRKSITPDALISFEDGKPYKTLRRHLGVRGLTPEQYREKWGLPKDYPMVAPSYSEARATMAKAIGLGARVKSNRSEVSAPANPARAKRASTAGRKAPGGGRRAAAKNGGETTSSE